MAATIVLSFLVTTLVIILVFPQTPTARVLHRSLVEGPIRFMHGLTRNKVGQIALTAAAFFLMMAMGPQMLGLMLTMGLDAAFVEVLILMYAASAWGRIANALRSMRSAAVKALMFVPNLFLRRSRRREARRSRKPGSRAGKEDKSGPQWSFA